MEKFFFEIVRAKRVDLRDAPLPQIALKIRFPGLQRVFVLHESEMAALGVTLAELLTVDLVLGRLPVDQVGQAGDTELCLLE